MNTIHYWTGRGTLCSLDNSVEQKPAHTQDKAAVTCPYCQYQIDLNSGVRCGECGAIKGQDKCGRSFMPGKCPVAA